ncbi:hypothetical protein R6Y90_05185 [Alteromonas macleodii]|uniref:hypothetical protein n=1 Tax=Alteromonas macleodii TaxID=28108 RepID=UPI0029819958|nr:hypothetical protein [Alteromonas macleodii]MDW5284357.1 hypothetical protein [Alteromonas macleodii]
MKHSFSKYGLVLSVLLFILSLDSSKAKAALIVNNEPLVPTAFGAVSFIDNTFSLGNPPSLLEDFSLTQMTTINKISFWSFDIPLSTGSEYISLRLYRDEPGFEHNSPLFSATGASGTGGTFSKTEVGDGVLFRHEIELVNFTLGPGDYFLNVGADPVLNNELAFGWAYASIPSTPGEYSWLLNPFVPSGAVNYSQSGVDFAFQIEGEPVVQANAPSALSILSLGLILMLVRRRV